MNYHSETDEALHIIVEGNLRGVREFMRRKYDGCPYGDLRASYQQVLNRPKLKPALVAKDIDATVMTILSSAATKTQDAKIKKELANLLAVAKTRDAYDLAHTMLGFINRQQPVLLKSFSKPTIQSLHTLLFKLENLSAENRLTYKVDADKADDPLYLLLMVILSLLVFALPVGGLFYLAQNVFTAMPMLKGLAVAGGISSAVVGLFMSDIASYAALHRAMEFIAKVRKA